MAKKKRKKTIFFKLPWLKQQTCAMIIQTTMSTKHTSDSEAGLNGIKYHYLEGKVLCCCLRYRRMIWIKIIIIHRTWVSPYYSTELSRTMLLFIWRPILDVIRSAGILCWSEWKQCVVLIWHLNHFFWMCSLFFLSHLLMYCWPVLI